METSLDTERTSFFPLRECIVVTKNVDPGVKIPEFKFLLFHLHYDLGNLHSSRLFGTKFIHTLTMILSM